MTFMLSGFPRKQPLLLPPLKGSPKLLPGQEGSLSVSLYKIEGLGNPTGLLPFGSEDDGSRSATDRPFASIPGKH